MSAIASARSAEEPPSPELVSPGQLFVDDITERTRHEVTFSETRYYCDPPATVEDRDNLSNQLIKIGREAWRVPILI